MDSNIRPFKISAYNRRNGTYVSRDNKKILQKKKKKTKREIKKANLRIFVIKNNHTQFR